MSWRANSALFCRQPKAPAADELASLNDVSPVTELLPARSAAVARVS